MENVTLSFNTQLPKCVLEEINSPEMSRVIYLKSGFVTDYAGYIKRQEKIDTAKKNQSGTVLTFKRILHLLSLVEHTLIFLVSNSVIYNLYTNQKI